MLLEAKGWRHEETGKDGVESDANEKVGRDTEEVVEDSLAIDAVEQYSTP